MLRTELLFPDLSCAGCADYADMAEEGIRNPCEGCALYEHARGMPRLAREAMNLYWLAHGGESARERWRTMKWKMPAWRARYVFDVWEMHDKLKLELAPPESPDADGDL